MTCSRISLLWGISLPGLLVASSLAHASQVPATPATSTTTTVPAVPANAPPKEARVLKVTVTDVSPGDCESEFAIGKSVVLTLDRDPRPGLAAGKNLGLFLNQLLIKGLPQQWVPAAPKFLEGLSPVPAAPAFLQFQLKQTNDNKDAWSQLLGRKRLLVSHTNKCECTEDEKTTFSLGLEDGSWFAATDPQVKCLEFLPTKVKAAAVFLVALFIAGLTIYLGKKSPMLRDSGDPRSDGQPGTYSLGRFQMALWFVTVVLASMYIYAVTGDVPVVPQGTLILMGIGAGTALGAAAIDLNKRVPGTQVAPSEGFFDDLLSDANGMSFHRLQVLGWTLVFWVVFLQSVFGKITMVDFDTTQLALMGISGSTYLGFKLQEKQS